MDVMRADRTTFPGAPVQGAVFAGRVARQLEIMGHLVAQPPQRVTAEIEPSSVCGVTGEDSSISRDDDGRISQTIQHRGNIQLFRNGLRSHIKSSSF